MSRDSTAEMHPPQPAGPPSQITVADVLAFEVVQRSLPEVVAGSSHLANSVRWAQTVEVLEASDLLKGGEFILATSVDTSGDEIRQRAFVRVLVEARASALGLEPSAGDSGARPEALIAEAERLEFPVILFRRRVPYADLLEAILTTIVSRRYAALEKASDVQRHLSEMVLEGRKMSEILTAIAADVMNPVFLVDSRNRLLAYAVTSGISAEEALAGWSALTADTRQREEQVTDACRRPVRVKGKLWGWLVATEQAAPLGPGAEMVLDHAATAVSFQLYRRRSDEVRGSTAGAFLLEMGSSGLPDEKLAQHARALGFDADRYGALLPIAGAFRTNIGMLDDETRWAAFLGEIEAAVEGLGLTALFGVVDEQLIGIVDLGLRGQTQALFDSIATAIRRPLGVHGVGLEEVDLAFGQSASSWAAAGREFGRIRDAATSARLNPAAPWRDARRTALPDLFYAMRDQPELTRFVDDQLGAIRALDPGREKALLETLEVYFRVGQNKAQAARALGLERQSLYQRLARIEELLRVDLEDASSALALQVALLATSTLERKT